MRNDNQKRKKKEKKRKNRIITEYRQFQMILYKFYNKKAAIPTTPNGST